MGIPWIKDRTNWDCRKFTGLPRGFAPRNDVFGFRIILSKERKIKYVTCKDCRL